MHDQVKTNAVSPDNSWWSHIRGTFAIGIPLIGAQLAQLGIHTTDVVILGQFGAQYLAAIVLAGQFLFTVFVFGTGFSMAVVPMVAQAYGRGDVTSVRRSLRMGLWVAIGYWLLMQPVFFSAEAILIHLGQQPETAALAGRYVAMAEFGLLPGLLFIALRSMVWPSTGPVSCCGPPCSCWSPMLHSPMCWCSAISACRRWAWMARPSLPSWCSLPAWLC